MTSLPLPNRFVAKLHTWSRRAFGCLRGDAFSREECLHLVQSLGENLETLGKSTEGEFLLLGKKLQDYYQRAGKLSEISGSVASLLVGEKTEEVIHGFRAVIERINLLEGESRKSAATLKRLLATLQQLNGNLSDFHKTVKSLGVLCVTIRVESARLGKKDIGFNVLADEVGKLALEIEANYSRLLTQTERLTQLIVQALSRASDIENRQHAQTRLMLDRTTSSLETLSKTHSRSSAGLAQIASRYGAISSRIGEIVSSMQFHDITRQRIEHAKEALDTISGNGQRGKGATGEDEETVAKVGIKRQEPRFGWNRRHFQTNSRSRQLRLAADVCELQIAQLCNARDALVSAVANILQNLGEVAGLVAEMTRETQKMAGSADQTEHSLVSEVQTGFSTVTSACSSYAETEREMSSVMGSLGETLADMSQFADAIEAIGERIKLIALNAIVKASHIGEEGATLAVLAESVHQLSVETRSRTEHVGETLRSMTAESQSLSASDRRSAGPASNESDRVQTVVTVLLNDLQGMNQSTTTLLAQMNDQGTALSKDILSALREVTVHDRVEKLIDGVVSRLEEIAKSARSLSPVEARLDEAEHLKALEASYTMQGEREIHRSLTASDPSMNGDEPGSGDTEAVNEPEAQSAVEESAEEDLGDNVELF